MSKKSNMVDIRMTKGEESFNDRNDMPEISVNMNGANTYVWVGQTATPGGCYATLSGPKTLEKLAMTILKGLGHKVTLR